MRRIFALIVLVLAVAVLGSPSANAATLNNFTIESFKSELQLGRDSEKRSTLKTTETIMADFPASNQNHGLERAIPHEYKGHSTSLDIVSVKDASGKSWKYKTKKQGRNTILRIGDAGSYVHGRQAFVITYTQRDVTAYFANTNDDELYWNINGTAWKVPIRELDVTLRIDEGLQGSLTGDKGCYQGTYGAKNKCAVTASSAGNVLHSRVQNLQRGENVTLVVGFKPQTFAAYQPSLLENIVTAVLPFWVIANIAAIAVLVWLGVKWAAWSNRKKELGTIVPEYLPPSDASVTTSASILSSSTKTFAVQLIDFAVRHYLKIYEIEKKGLFGGKDYELEIVRDINSLRAEEQEILSDIFSGNTAEGQKLKLSKLKNNSKVAKSVLDNDKKLQALVRGDYELRERNTNQSKWFTRAGWILLALSIVLLNPVLLGASIMAFVCGHVLWPLTDKGLALYRYLEGLKMYIKTAETERLKMLQSPEGAEKVGSVDSEDPKQLVKLYERVLPYAILFGQEKEWNKEIGKYYESMESQPDWYSGNNAVFNAAVFSSAMSSFSSASTYSAGSSSSSGGTGGGGYSGGGGGGGGGGGW